MRREVTDYLLGWPVSIEVRAEMQRVTGQPVPPPRIDSIKVACDECGMMIYLGPRQAKLKGSVSPLCPWCMMSAYPEGIPESVVVIEEQPGPGLVEH